MIWVEPGTFTMGSPTSEAGRGTDETETQVTLTQGLLPRQVRGYPGPVRGGDDRQQRQPQPHAFQLCRFGFTGGTGQLGRHSNLSGALERAGGRQPAPGLGLCPAHRSPVGICLPCRHHHGVFLGDDINASLANYDSNIGQTANVGSYGANPWGFFDMHGNVWEWVTDWYAEPTRRVP